MANRHNRLRFGCAKPLKGATVGHPGTAGRETMSDLYDTDFVTWSQRQADLLRRRAAGELVNESDIDWPNVAEEIEALGKNEERALASKLAIIMEHMLKLEASPATDPRAGWRATIRRERTDIHRLLKSAPSLRRTVAAVMAEELGAARSEAAASLADNGETPRIAIDGAAYTEDQVLGDWLP
jgi:hypothetical protein